MEQNKPISFDDANNMLEKFHDSSVSGRFNEIKKNEKKMREYVNRLSDLVFKGICKTFPDYAKRKTDLSHEWLWLTDFSDLASLCAKNLYINLCDYTKRTNPKNPYRASVKFHFFISLQLDEDSKNKLRQFLDGEPIPYGETKVTYREIFDHEFAVCCESFLKRQLEQNENMDVNNFLFFVSIRRIDEKQINFIEREIINDLIPRLLFDISLLFSSSLQKAMENEELNKARKERDELRKELKKKEKELAEKDRVSKEKDEKISLLASKLSKKEKEKERDNSEEVENLSYENKSLLRQNQKLQNYYSDLLSKYEKLKEKMQEEGKDVEEEKVEEMRKVDLNARYLFFMGDDIKCRAQIKEMFPNAEFTSKSSNFSLTAYDMVVIMSGCVDHKHYWRIKEQCKIHGIPFAHSPHSNLEMIKTMIWNVLN